MSRELLQRTLRALTGEGGPGAYIQSLVADIEKELEKPEHEPLGYISESMARIALNDGAWDFVNMSRLKISPWDMPLYTHPSAQQEPLSDAEIEKLWIKSNSGIASTVNNFARAIEKAHGIEDNHE